MKPITFMGDSLDQIRTFPADARQDAGYQLRRVQKGNKPTHWKPMSSIGTGVREIRTKAADGIYRTIYLAKLKDAVYVLHAFKKKTQKTSTSDIEMAKKRLKDLMRNP